MSHNIYLLSCFISFFTGFAIAFFNRNKTFKKALTSDLSFTERSIVAKVLSRKNIKF